MKVIRVILVDDHRLIRDGLKTLLRSQSDMHVVGEADDGNDAIRLAADLVPDVVVMDVSMPNMSGLDAARTIIAANREIGVVILSAYVDRRVAAEAFDAGARALVRKEAAFEEFCLAIRRVADEKTYLSPQFIGDLSSSILAAATRAGRAFRKLSDRERHILRSVIAGKTSKEIAFELGLSVKTIDSHRRQIMQKLDVKGVPELTKQAIRLGWTPA